MNNGTERDAKHFLSLVCSLLLLLSSPLKYSITIINIGLGQNLLYNRRVRWAECWRNDAVVGIQ